MTVRWPEPLEVVQQLVDASEARGKPLTGSIVLVGGSALAAHGIRAESRDVDLYTPAVDDDVVEEVERSLKVRLGARFRLDVTSVGNIWGIVMIHDLGRAPKVAEIVSPSGRRHSVRALRVEDLFVLKVASSRKRDHEDLPLIARHTSMDAIIARFNELLPGIGNRAAVPAIADAFVRSLASLYDEDPATIVEQLAVSAGVKNQLREAPS